MNILTALSLSFIIIFTIDALIRFACIMRLHSKIHRHSSQRKRTIELGKGKQSITIALLGDSVMYGEGSEYDLPAIHHIAHQLVTQRKQVTINNYAVTGHTIAQLIDSQLPQTKPNDLLVIYIGANNYFRFTSPAVFGKEVDRLLEQVRDRTVIWCTLGDPRYLYLLPVWLQYLYYRYAIAYMRYVEKAIRQHPQEKWYTIDFLYEGSKRIRIRKMQKRAVLLDGFHLSLTGHELWASVMNDGYNILKKQGANLP